ncbi:MAG: DUF3617 family protein [Comamonas sp.]|uniref:DUF3617 domain-containing protein n=1 Tax=Comamonas sp. BIGb0152 TaxID=2940601 RepID=UPI002168655B|nr:DUF3617 family protein [Comamonas sp. BIGb0152]MCS4292836.1 hypothetical protein [Comamonas sp. BIGb0152]
MLSTRSITALSAIAAALLAAGCATTTGDIEDLPRPKSGHWQISSTDQDGQTVQFQDCMDKDTFYKTRELQKAKYEVQQCQTGSRKDSNGWQFTSNCKVGQTEQRIESSRKISGDFQNNFHVLSVTKQQMPDGSTVETTRNIKGEYLGACPAGTNPGDRVFSSGDKINFYDITGLSPK